MRGNVCKARLEGLLQKYITIRRGTKSPHHGSTWPTGADTGCHSLLAGGIEFLVGHILYLFHILLVNAQLLEYSLAQCLAHGLGVHVQDRTAHDNRLVEKPFGRRHAEQGTHLAATARFTKDGHIIGVAAKLLDVVVHPLQRLHHIKHTHIARVLV